jgi:hypothetical protein
MLGQRDPPTCANRDPTTRPPPLPAASRSPTCSAAFAMVVLISGSKDRGTTVTCEAGSEAAGGAEGLSRRQLLIFASPSPSNVNNVDLIPTALGHPPPQVLEIAPCIFVETCRSSGCRCGSRRRRSTADTCAHDPRRPDYGRHDPRRPDYGQHQTPSGDSLALERASGRNKVRKA